MQSKTTLLRTLLRSALAPIVCVVIVSPAAHAQAFSVLHNFTNAGDGAYPSGSLILDSSGNLYGTAADGGNAGCNNLPAPGCGTAFKMHKQGSGWTLGILGAFTSSQPQNPAGRLLRDANGILYGVSGGPGVGAVYQLRPSSTPPVSVISPWNVTQLYAFAGGNDDGAFPSGGLTADAAGNFYGTTLQGGTGSGGTVYKLIPSGGGWTYSVLHNFVFASPNGSNPVYGVVLDTAGNLYGSASNGGQGGCGVIYKLTPAGAETVLYSFTNGEDGCEPFARVILDASGNLYGATSAGGVNGGGVAFELSPSGGGWTYKAIYSFSGQPTQFQGPQESLVLDAAGNLYGATSTEGVFGGGNVFKLTPSHGSWIYSSVYDFTGGNDGYLPSGAPVIDPSGKIYGMTAYGGAHGYGVVYEIAP